MRTLLVGIFVALALCANQVSAAAIKTDCYTLSLGAEWKQAPGGTGSDEMIYLERNAIYAKISCAKTTIPVSAYPAYAEFSLTQNASDSTKDLAKLDSSVELVDKSAKASADDVTYRYLWRGQEKTLYQTIGTIRNGKMLVVTVRSVGLTDAKNDELIGKVVKSIRW